MAFEAPKKLVFLHIPKTAGSSVGQFLDSQFAPNEICKIYSGNAREQLKVALANPEIRFIRGHFGLYAPLLAELENPDVFIFTFLRDPVQRVISLYNHMHRRQTLKHADRMHEVNNLKSFLALKSDFNEQTRYLSGIEDKSTFRKKIDQGFEKAIENSKKLSFIGITENLEADFKKLCGLLNVQAESIPYRNKGLSTIKQIVMNALFHNSVSKHDLWDTKLYNQLKRKEQ